MKSETVKRIIAKIEKDAPDVNIMFETRGGRTFVVNPEHGDAINFEEEDPDIMVLDTSMGTRWLDMGDIMFIDI